MSWFNFWKKNSSVFLDKKNNQEKWKELMQVMDYRQELNYKLAIIQADQLLSDNLKKMGYTQGPVLKQLNNAILIYPKLKKVLWAHKMRLRFEEKNFMHIKFGLAMKCLHTYKQALKNIKAL